MLSESQAGAPWIFEFAGVGGEKFAASGNVGMLDTVAALEWIRDNISNFGGDPGNVTIMGQSGAGAKVCTLTSMPSAKGLFRKAVALSGSTLNGGQNDYSEKLGSYILEEAGIAADQIHKLQDMPWREYYAIANKASIKLRTETGVTGMMGGFGPVADGLYIPQQTFYTGELSSNIPMIICSTFYERSTSSFDSSLENITFDKAKEMAKTIRSFGVSLAENASNIIDAYSRNFPDKKPIEILSWN